MTLQTRPSSAEDAREMSRILSEILQLWKSERPSDPDHVQAHYIAHPDSVACTIAQDDGGEVLGFQSLRLARYGNQYGVTPGWGFIGTYVRLGQSGRGIGRLLFNTTRIAAQKAGLPAIDATIAADNDTALAYYQALGFRTYRTPQGAICKRFNLD